MRKRILSKKSEMEGIIQKCKVCYLGMSGENNMPYVLPFNFGYKDPFIYLHSGLEGKKIEIMKKFPSVCAVFSTDHELAFQSEKVACSYGMKFRSVLVFGKIVFIEDAESKIEAMNIIMKNYVEKEFTYSAPAIGNIAVFKIDISEMTGKEVGYS